MSNQRAIITCLRCKQTRDHAGRGLCINCHYATGKDGTRSNYPLTERPRRKPGPAAVTAVTCVCCGRSGRYEGRGLITACYKQRKRNGTLHQFEKLERPSKSKTCACSRRARREGDVSVPRAVLGALLAGAPTELEEWAEQQLGHELVTLAVDAAEGLELAVSA